METRIQTILRIYGRIMQKSGINSDRAVDTQSVG